MTVTLTEWQEVARRAGTEVLRVQGVDLAELVDRCVQAEARADAAEQALAEVMEAKT